MWVLQNLNQIFHTTPAQKVAQEIMMLRSGRTIKDTLLQKAKLPAIIVDGKDLIFAAGAQPLVTIDRPSKKRDWGEAMAILFSMYYVFAMSYPSGLEVGMLMIQALSLETRERIDSQDTKSTKFNQVWEDYHKWQGEGEDTASVDEDE